MIIIISGGVGSGKSLTAVRCAVEESKNNRVITNFKLKNIKNYYRLKKEDVLIDKSEDPKKKDIQVNWDFWEKTRNVDIFLDELHNLINSRTAMKKENIKYSEWISQIRKIWGDQGDQNHIEALRRMPLGLFQKHVDAIVSKSNNIYLITQRVRKIDINFRELAHIYIQCKKMMVGDQVVIINSYWFGDDNNDAIEYAMSGVRPRRRAFIGNEYFKYYDSYELISTGGEWL